jgi:nucleoid DNA-binding protein
MNARELERQIAAGSGLSREQAKAALRSFTDGVGCALEAGEAVRVSGIGTFRPVHRAARRIRHPATGAEIRIAARRRTRFNPSKKLRDIISRR